MKRVLALTMAMIVCLASFAGCGSKEVKLDEVMSKINSEFSLSLKSIDSVDELNKYYSINADDVKQFAAEIDSNNNAPVEIVMVEANDKAAADNIASALGQRYNSIISQYASYTPDKLDMVKKCKVTNENNFVTLIVAENGEAILKSFNESIQ